MAAKAIWEPSQYLKFADARMQPALDLLVRIAMDNPRHVYDLGCGTGNVTRILQRRWPEAVISGIDNSENMLVQAACAGADIKWVRQELANWQPDDAADVIFSSAALHWLPRHEELLPRLMSFLAPRGVLAIQMPRNFSAPSHTLIAETVRAGRWRARLEPLLRPVPVESPSWYFKLLEPLVREIAVWETEYLQVLQGTDPVKEWVKGTWLKPLLDALDAPDSDSFEADYARSLRVAYPALPSGVTLFPFKRLFVTARR